MDLLTAPLIQLRKVSFSYKSPHIQVLSQIDFSLFADERVALMGANGSGKSTLLHLLVGLLRPSTGEIEIFGQVRREEPDFVKVRGAIGLLFQETDDQLFCPTVVEDIAFGPLNQSKSKIEVQEIINNTLKLVNLKGYEERITYKLSGGEKRLVALATVLAMQPEILLLDEPTNGLDEDFQQRLTEVLLQLPQAMLIVSHDKNFLARVTQRQVLLREGRLVTEV